jgi:hypothetical protein
MREWEEEEAGIWGRMDSDSGEGRVRLLPHVDLLLCRFSTERIEAWNIFRLCTWIRPKDEEGAKETEPEPGSGA